MPQDFERSKPRKDDDQNNPEQGSNTSKHSDDTNKNRQREISEREDTSFSDQTDVLARRDEQTHDYKAEAQNVNDDTGRALNEDELNRARNKATEGLRQKDEEDNSVNDG